VAGWPERGGGEPLGGDPLAPTLITGSERGRAFAVERRIFLLPEKCL